MLEKIVFWLVIAACVAIILTIALGPHDGHSQGADAALSTLNIAVGGE